MATTYTPNFGFGKQENYADTFSMEVITTNFDTLDTLLKDAVRIKGVVSKYANLPANASEGDTYRVTYSDDNYADNTPYMYHNGTWISLAKNSYLKAEIDNIDRAELANIIDSGAKNKLNISKSSVKTINTSGTWSGDTYTRTDNNNNISITVNNDMSFTINGTTATRVQFTLSNTGLASFQNFVLSGGNVASDTISVLLQEVGGAYATIGQDFGTGVELGDYDSSRSYSLSINISANTVADNIVIKPMICSKSAWALSTKYVPYCPTLAEIYAMVQ